MPFQKSILKALRLKNGYTQQNIADMLGFNRSTYTYYTKTQLKASQNPMPTRNAFNSIA